MMTSQALLFVAWLVLNAVGDVGEGTGGDAGARHETHALVRLSDRQLQRRLLGKTVRLCKHITNHDISYHNHDICMLQTR